ncbi:MAG: porin [Thermodesulfobacteriota bacterium]|nr:porin [Thermodesulfobacteriota bacterium]
MKVWQSILMLILSGYLFLGMAAPSLAENLALEKLLEILGDKGVITAPELQAVKEAVAEDQERLLQQEREMTERKKGLGRWEEELQEKEEALKAKESALFHSQLPPPEKAPTVSTTAPSLARKTEEKIPAEASHEDGFCLSTLEPKLFSLCLGGLLQADYRYFDYEATDPNENRFDLRRVRLRLRGQTLGLFDYKFEYEFQGAASRNLLDAYADAHLFPFASFRIGQFKEPFSLEHCTLDSLGFFAERSMGYYLTPRRDLGLMAHASLWEDRINYGLGMFNGDGLDDAEVGDVDDPEFTARATLMPFKDWGASLLQGLQVGGSFSYANIDHTNVEIHVKTTGLTELFDVASRAKFNIIRQAEHRSRYGAELAWVWGPLAVTGESTYVLFEDIATSAERFDFELQDSYASLLWMITGEEPAIQNGVFQPMKPTRGVHEGGWGAFGLAFRYDFFEADEIAYEVLINEGDSVREAEACTIALNWYPTEFVRVVLDITRTNFDRPLLIDRDPLTGEAIYSDREDVVTGRIQFGF